MNLIILGAPASGKGTQADMLSKKMNIPHISSNILREYIETGTEDAMKVKATMEVGGLVPNKLVYGIIENKLLQDDYKRGFIIDGAPRNMEQLKLQNDMIKRLNLKIDAVIFLKVSNDILYERITKRMICKKCRTTYQIKSQIKDTYLCSECGGKLEHRVDDSRDIFERRLKEQFIDKTTKVMGYYIEKKILIEVNGDGRKEDIHAEILDRLK